MAENNSVTMKTKSLVEKYDFTWIINNFSRYIEEIESAVFTPLSGMKTEFSVSLKYGCYTNGYIIPSIYIKKRTDIKNLNNLCVVADLKFTDAQGSILKIISKCGSRRFGGFGEIYLGTLSETNGATGWNVFNVGTIPSEDTVIVKIHFEFFNHKVMSTSIAPVLIKTDQNLSVLSTDFKKLYISKALTDISIQIDGTALQAHQAVLVARSPVFKKMMEGSYLESESKRLTITDVHSDVFESFLKYLYSGVVEDETFSTAWRLYSVADKYEVSSLQEDCAGILASNLNAENVCSVLELSYLHSDKPLKDKAVSFISTNFDVIKSKLEWIGIVNKYPELTSEVLGFIIACLKS